MAFNILIVDDSGTTRAIIKRAVMLSGMPIDKITEAGDGSAALTQLATRSADLVFADLNMPVMDGLQMIGRMSTDPKTSSIPVVVISADPNADQAALLNDLGVRGYLRKPFTPEAIRTILNEVLGGVSA